MSVDPQSKTFGSVALGVQPAGRGERGGRDMVRVREQGLASVVGLIALGAAACVLALVALPRGAPSELLCSDGRCGEGSKLTRDNAVKDLDKYADKAELKDRLDELQTVMERGMTHKDEVRQLNSYFGDLERTVRSQRRHALRQARTEGIDSPVLSSARGDAALPSLHTQAKHSGGGAGGSSSSSGEGSGASHGSHEARAEEAAGGHGSGTAEKGRSSTAELNSYFDSQARKIREENRKQLHASKLSASQAKADLNSYFDSLQAAPHKEAKMHSVVQKLDKLTTEVRALKEPVAAMRGDAETARSSLKTLETQNRDIQLDNKRILAYDRRSRSSAQAHSQAQSQLTASAHAAHNENPRIKMVGLPPDWEAYEDENTNYPYFYNTRTGTSTWVSPKGTEVAAKGLPSEWGAFKSAKGETYFSNKDTGQSSFEDPRVAPGAKVLALMRQVNAARSRLTASKEETAKLAAVSANHGVYGHVWPRSQWADRGWMKWLNSSNARGMGSILTNGQQLREGMMGSEHAPLQKVASSNY